MGKHDKFKEKKVAAYKRELKEVETKQGKKDPLIVLSFKNFDINQGQSFEEWQAEELLSVAVNKLRALCEYTIPQATNAGMLKFIPKFRFLPNLVLNTRNISHLTLTGVLCISEINLVLLATLKTIFFTLFSLTKTTNFGFQKRRIPNDKKNERITGVWQKSGFSA